MRQKFSRIDSRTIRRRNNNFGKRIPLIAKLAVLVILLTVVTVTVFIVSRTKQSQGTVLDIVLNDYSFYRANDDSTHFVSKGFNNYLFGDKYQYTIEGSNNELYLITEGGRKKIDERVLYFYGHSEKYDELAYISDKNGYNDLYYYKVDSEPLRIGENVLPPINYYLSSYNNPVLFKNGLTYGYIDIINPEKIFISIYKDGEVNDILKADKDRLIFPYAVTKSGYAIIIETVSNRVVSVKDGVVNEIALSNTSLSVLPDYDSVIYRNDKNELYIHGLITQEDKLISSDVEGFMTEKEYDRVNNSGHTEFLFSPVIEGAETAYLNEDLIIYSSGNQLYSYSTKDDSKLRFINNDMEADFNSISVYAIDDYEHLIVSFIENNQNKARIFIQTQFGWLRINELYDYDEVCFVNNENYKEELLVKSEDSKVMIESGFITYGIKDNCLYKITLTNTQKISDGIEFFNVSFKGDKFIYKRNGKLYYAIDKSNNEIDWNTSYELQGAKKAYFAKNGNIYFIDSDSVLYKFDVVSKSSTMIMENVHSLEI